uniref:hypothetical protein n=1 Tax=Stappia sp. TaxID=1870903 RepID=UPI003BAC697F
MKTAAIALLLAATATGLTPWPAVAEAATVQTERIQVAPPEVDRPNAIPQDPEAGETPDPEAGTAPSDLSAPLPVNLPEIHYGDADLPKPVARMRAQLLEAAHAGDLDRIRMVLEGNEMMPTLSFGQIDDPIDFLKEASGDGEGLEIMAILTEVLEAGYVHADVGSAQEMYIWPYFARYPLARLSREQKVEMYRIVTSGDYADMAITGTWTFYRVGIGPDGTLHYFVAGE